MRQRYDSATADSVIGQATLQPRHLAWSLALAAMAVVVATIAMGAYYILTSGDLRTLLSHQALTPFITAGFAVIGALVASRRPRNPIGWLFLATGGLYALSALVVVVQLVAPEVSHIAKVATWFGIWLWIPGVFLPTAFIFLLFPEGRLPSPSWRPLAWVSGLGLAAVTLALALHPGPLASWGTGPNPLGVRALEPLLTVVVNLAGPLLLLAVLGSVAALIVRLRHARGATRQQLTWLVYAATLMLLGFILSAVLWPAAAAAPWLGEIAIAMTNLTILGIALAAAIAILQHRLYDIDLIINRTLVYGSLTAGVTTLYVLVVTALGTIFQAQGNLFVTLVATGLVAVLFQPLRERLQQLVNRLMYGERDDPHTVLARLGKRLETTLAPDAVLPTLVETIAQALKLPHVALALGYGATTETVASYGRPKHPPSSFPLVYQSEVIGELVLEPRAPDEPFTAPDVQLIETIAQQASIAAYAVRLTADLQKSRERLVSAREEERRRLRRDLHDGLGPALAGMTLKLDAAHNVLNQNPSAVEPLLVELREQVQALINDLRRLVYALRPPALDELGLVAALREQAHQYEQESLDIDLQALDPMPPLPAAVEVAAYRIVQEALTNVVRHAKARSCRVSLTPGRCLEIVILDDGVGLPAAFQAGVGLTSMQERTAELGGQFHISNRLKGGTNIVVRLPLSEDACRTRSVS